MPVLLYIINFVTCIGFEKYLCNKYLLRIYYVKSLGIYQWTKQITCEGRPGSGMVGGYRQNVVCLMVINKEKARWEIECDRESKPGWDLDFIPVMILRAEKSVMLNLNSQPMGSVFHRNRSHSFIVLEGRQSVLCVHRKRPFGPRLVRDSWLLPSFSERRIKDISPNQKEWACNSHLAVWVNEWIREVLWACLGHRKLVVRIKVKRST